jgi:hypothetical protein
MRFIPHSLSLVSRQRIERFREIPQGAAIRYWLTGALSFQLRVIRPVCAGSNLATCAERYGNGKSSETGNTNGVNPEVHTQGADEVDRKTAVDARRGCALYAAAKIAAMTTHRMVDRILIFHKGTPDRE